MIEYINSFLLLTLLGIIYYIYYKYKIFLHAINIVMDSIILDQLNNLGKDVDSEVKLIKTKVTQTIKCTCTVFTDNFRNISTNSLI